ncbi:MAG: TetR/AcrR family transcriptional regulator [Anaerolineae bacterium]
MTPQERGAETRTRILAAATDCFAAQGYDATGVAEICARAQVSKGAFYHHFAGKQALFLALLEGWLADLDTRLSASRMGASSAPEALVHMVDAFANVLRSASGHLPLFLEFWAQAQRDPVIKAATIEPYRRYHRAFAELIAQGVAEGALRPVDPSVAARSIVSLAIGLLLQSLLDPDGADWVAVAAASVALLVAGLRPEPQNPRKEATA